MSGSHKAIDCFIDSVLLSQMIPKSTVPIVSHTIRRKMSYFSSKAVVSVVIGQTAATSFANIATQTKHKVIRSSLVFHVMFLIKEKRI